MLHVELECLPPQQSTLDQAHSKSLIVLRVIDDGPGIPEADWERLRKPFSPRSGARVGASLGLSIVEEVMQQHGGTLQFGFTAAGHFMVQLRFVALH